MPRAERVSTGRRARSGAHAIGTCASYFSIYGSVIPRSLPYALFGAVEGVILKWASNNFDGFDLFLYWQMGGSWYHPYAFHVFGMMLGFALVMRIQIACGQTKAEHTPCLEHGPGTVESSDL